MSRFKRNYTREDPEKKFRKMIEANSDRIRAAQRDVDRSMIPYFFYLYVRPENPVLQGRDAEAGDFNKSP